MCGGCIYYPQYLIISVKCLYNEKHVLNTQYLLLLLFCIMTGQDWQKTAECKTEWQSAEIHASGGGVPSEVKEGRNHIHLRQKESRTEPR